jgi:hypothetical protein
MAKLEELSSGASVRGVAGDAIATIVNVNWYGSNCVDVVYKTSDGRVSNDNLAFRSSSPAVSGVLRAMENCFALLPKPTGFI